jgi:hypothetical protein
MNLLNIEKTPTFLKKYLSCKSLTRLKKVGYFCGMDYASKDIYDFREYISRYDHSLTVALLVYKLTKNKLATLRGLFHDVGTPVFSHVIDYMNKDYEEQESTEELTEKVILNDKYLLKCLSQDKINPEDIIDFKKSSVVDNKRPKLCADRLDGVILTGIGWTKNITLDDIKDIIDNITIYQNEDNEDEIGFTNLSVAKKVLDISKSIDYYCHTKEDNYMMNLLADITKELIDKDLISYNDLFFLNEEDIIKLLSKSTDRKIKTLFTKFKNIKLDEIGDISLPPVKIRKLHPLVNGERII